jgi:hypothetical protein
VLYGRPVRRRTPVGVQKEVHYVSPRVCGNSWRTDNYHRVSVKVSQIKGAPGDVNCNRRGHSKKGREKIMDEYTCFLVTVLYQKDKTLLSCALKVKNNLYMLWKPKAENIFIHYFHSMCRVAVLL